MLRTAVVFLILSFIWACAPVESSCPYDSEQAPVANAGCLAVDQGRILVIEQRSGVLSIPGGTSEPGEGARCTAYRETYEETGLKLAIGPLLEVFANGFHLYQCTYVDRKQVLAPKDLLEVRGASWRRPETVDGSRWRFPGQWPQLQQWSARISAEGSLMQSGN